MNRKWLNTGLFLLPILAILYVYRNVIFFGGIFSNQDTIYNYLPYYLSFVKGVFIEHAILGGFPVYTTMQATWFSPFTKILLAIFSPANAYIFADIFFVVLTYVFTYLFARKLNFRHEVAIISATIYLFAGQVMLWSHTPLITLYHFMLPASLYLYEEFKNRRHLWSKAVLVILIGLLFGFGWISGHVQFNVYVHTLFALYIFFDLLVWSERNKKNILTFVGICFVVFIISFLVGLPQIDAVLATQPYTMRAFGVDVSQLYGLGYMPYTVLQYILPSFRIFYPPVTQSFQNYIGLLPLVILLGWYLSISKWYPRIVDKKYKFFVGVFIFCILIALYKSPLAMATHFIPLYKSFRESVRLMFIGDFALALMAGYIFQTMAVHKFSPDSFKKTLGFLKKLTLYLIGPGVLLVTVFKLFFLGRVEEILKKYYVAKQFKNASGDLPLEHYTTLIHTYLERDVYQLTLLSLHIIGMFAICALVYWLLKRAGKMHWEKFLAVAIIIIVLDFSWVYYDRFPVVPKQDLFTRGVTTETIFEREKGNEQDYRYISVLGEVALWRESVRCGYPDLNNWNLSTEEFELRKELIDPNFNIYSGLQSADGYEPFMVRHISDVTGFVGSRQSAGPSDLETIASLPKLSEKVSRIIERKNVLRSLNIKYVISPYEIKDKDFIEVKKEEVGKCKSVVYLYELTNPYPRFFLTKNIVSQPEIDPKETMDVIMKSEVPVAVLHASTTIVRDYALPIPLTPRYEGNLITFSIPQTSSDYVMNIGLTWMPGWHIRADGKPLEIIRANHWAMAALIPKNTKILELYYEPKSYFKAN